MPRTNQLRFPSSLFGTHKNRKVNPEAAKYAGVRLTENAFVWYIQGSTQSHAAKMPPVSPKWSLPTW